MPEVSIKDQLKKLVEIQKLDKEIFDLKSDLKDKPQILNELKEEFDGKKAGLQDHEEKLKEVQLKRKEQELELQTKEQEIAKSNADLSQIKTNKEYTAKLTEIEGIKADKSRIEEIILLSYDEADAASAKIDEEKKLLVEEEKKYNDKKKEIEASVKQIEDRVKVLEGQRNQLTPEIDKITLSQYERVLSSREGLAIVPVQGDACGGCYMNVTQQVINLIKMHTEFVNCEKCTRILYIEDDLL